MWIAVITVATLMGTAIWLHDLLKGERLLADLVDEWRLARQDLAVADARWQNASSQAAIVVCLTTIPSRLPLLADTLKSLMRQSRAPARIVLHLPRLSLREGRAYEVPPSWRTLQALQIIEVEDLGPATKLLPALTRYRPDQMLVVVDDDRIYPPNFLADLETAALHQPDAAFCMGGWRVPDDRTDRPTTLLSNLFMRPPTPVRPTRLTGLYRIDILQGYAGYLVRPRFFDLAAVCDYSSAPHVARQVDDVWISAHCKAKKFAIAAPRSNYQAKRHMALYHKTSLGLLNRGEGTPDSRPNTVMIRHFSQRWSVDAGEASRRPARIDPPVQGLERRTKKEPKGLL